MARAVPARGKHAAALTHGTAVLRDAAEAARTGRAATRACCPAGASRDSVGGCHQTRSKIAAMPWPPPMHMVTSAKRPETRFSS
jgi:hypothetical protein